MRDLEYNKDTVFEEGWETHMRLEEKTVSSEPIFDGRILHVRRDLVTLPDGKQATREVVHHIGAVAVLPLTESGEVILERQFRYPFGEVLVEIPAGKLESPEEDPRRAALRELEEETGMMAEHLEFLGDYYPSPAVFDERIRLYLATGLAPTHQHTDEDEFLEVFTMPLDKLIKEIMAGNIPDGKTQVAALRVYHTLQNKKGEQVDEAQL